MKPAAFKKWIPAALAPAVVAAFAMGAAFSANAQAQLEPKTPQQVLQMIADSQVTDFSGTARSILDMGIPQLPDAGSADPMQDPGATGTHIAESPQDNTATPVAGLLAGLAALSGTHEARVYVDGPDKARIQVLDSMNERNIIYNGTSLWYYDSAANSAVHLQLPEMHHRRQGPPHAMQPPTPGRVAEGLLEAMGANTGMSVRDDTQVAGRDAYTLELLPRSDESLIAKVSLGIDAATGVPLEVVVQAVGQEDPALEVGFTDFTPETPAAELFEFTPPPGAEVKEHKLPKNIQGEKPGHRFGHKQAHQPEAGPGHENRKRSSEHPNAEKPGVPRSGHKNAAGQSAAVNGSGWEAVAVIPAADVPAQLAANELLNLMSTPVQGGRLLHTSLLNVLITDDGRMLMGAVTLARLQAVAAGP